MFDYTKLQNRCLAPEKSFWGIGETIQTKDGNLEFIDNKSKVLGVAHLDSVTKTKHFYKLKVNGITYVLNPQLDDRIGAYVILDLLPELGVKYDILLTTGEEKGKSTAAFFDTFKQYNWMFSFDREGEDVVHYRYRSTDFIKALEDAGFKSPSHGRRSDIDYLEDLGCCGFNVGTGLKDGHSMWAINDMNVLERQVNRFLKFYKTNKDKYWEHKTYTPSPIYTPVKYVRCKGVGCTKEISEEFAKKNKGLCFICAKGDLCINCGGKVDGDSIWKDVCSKCLETHDVCVVRRCSQLTPKNRTYKGMCSKCVTLAKSGVADYTTTRCSSDDCNNPLLSTELLRGDICSMCFSRSLRKS